jgi:cytochrome c5
MRDRWLTGMVVALSALTLVASVLFACSRGGDEEASSTTQPASITGAKPQAPVAQPTPESTATAPARAEPQAADAPSGAAVYKARCARCHSLEEAVGLIKKKPAPEREAWMTQLFTRHFPPPVKERPPLIRYLLEETARAER